MRPTQRELCRAATRMWLALATLHLSMLLLANRRDFLLRCCRLAPYASDEKAHKLVGIEIDHCSKFPSRIAKRIAIRIRITVTTANEDSGSVRSSGSTTSQK